MLNLTKLQKILQQPLKIRKKFRRLFLIETSRLKLHKSKIVENLASRNSKIGEARPEKQDRVVLRNFRLILIAIKSFIFNSIYTFRLRRQIFGIHKERKQNA